MSNSQKTNIYQSNGSDGYTPGTWGAVVHVTTREGDVLSYYDAGWECQEHAAEWAARKTEELSGDQ